jgi:endonuclease YncB( thermonuclease family)
LKDNFSSNASKVQQRLHENPRWQNAQPQSPWQWGIYEYLPSSPETKVVRAVDGNTLTVTNTVGLTQAIGPVGRHSRLGIGRMRGFVPAPSAPLSSQTVPVGGEIRIRLAGVAAPMNGQALFEESTEHLAKWSDQNVRIVPVGRDADGTVVAQVFVSSLGTYLNEQQIRDGMARNAVEDGLDPSLANAEEQAQLKGKGLWKNKAVASP